jgi:hypothetical protein
MMGRSKRDRRSAKHRFGQKHSDVKAEVKKYCNPSSTIWASQEGLRQEVLTLHDIIPIQNPVTPGTVPVTHYNNVISANANGYRYFSADNVVSDFKAPQQSIWDTFAKLYRYYACEEIVVEFIPAR